MLPETAEARWSSNSSWNMSSWHTFIIFFTLITTHHVCSCSNGNKSIPSRCNQFSNHVFRIISVTITPANIKNQELTILFGYHEPVSSTQFISFDFSSMYYEKLNFINIPWVKKTPQKFEKQNLVLKRKTIKNTIKY